MKSFEKKKKLVLFAVMMKSTASIPAGLLCIIIYNVPFGIFPYVSSMVSALNRRALMYVTLSMSNVTPDVLLTHDAI